MPIPTRPISVNHHPRHNKQKQLKPGYSVPRKSTKSLSNSLDWKNEIENFNSNSNSNSLPELKGRNRLINIINNNNDNVIQFEEFENKNNEIIKSKREVCLNELIKDGKGKREKRVTTATSLGFDFIPNNIILTLPNSCDQSISNLTSLLNKSKVKSISQLKDNDDLTTCLKETQFSILSNSEPEDEDEIDFDLNDWEFIPSLNNNKNNNNNNFIEEDDNLNSEGEEDVIILGELELDDYDDDDIVVDDDVNSKFVKPIFNSSKTKKLKKDKISYADILSLNC
ncbi:uncharacterized protein I206_105872 [Kwoniella pini CBS 10737]|uniref:Uncharacterized protein n=1 Tax=Kwoniella pini CBS 10737 TaxID=1296096 RepID=A0A1B9I0G0_9TREE|nr:uncharacterized protein I206_04692 [Kwoniella pini CBS 10737]OCF49005.1 hypothetical protein I206_04692 [Kwoniella pini CBS 10737]